MVGPYGERGLDLFIMDLGDGVPSPAWKKITEFEG